MSKKSLKIISASAGSGKTYTLTERLIEQIRSGKLKPENLVAVTFTEAGASELKGRIRAALLEKGLFEAAQRVESAYISTIHAFGSVLLKDLAFDLALPLSTRMLNEEEQSQLIRISMNESEELINIANDLERYGYKAKPKAGGLQSAEDSFRAQLLQFLDLLRSTGRNNPEQTFMQASIDWLEKKYGHVNTDIAEVEMAKMLQSAVKCLLTEFPQCPIDEFGLKAESAVKAFKQNYRDLNRAATTSALDSDWALWERLTQLKVNARDAKGAKRIEQYTDLAQSVIDTAQSFLSVHPGPRRQATKQLMGLMLGAGQTLSGYADRKRDSRLIDYTDMIAGTERALRDRALRDRVIGTIQTVVVDEFQDTNPIQFAFLWHLISTGVDATLVGDMKQSIMGFQGADPRLLGSLLEYPEAQVSSLENNWRSQPKLLSVINDLTTGLCSTEGMTTPYSPLGAKGKESELPPLHWLVFRDKPKKDKDQPEKTPPSERQWFALNVAKSIKAKLEEGQIVVDRHTKVKRPIRPADFAILCPTNGMIKTYAAALEAQGIAVNTERAGWFDKEETQLAIELLKLFANPTDLHARLFVACSFLGGFGLEEALAKVLDTGNLPLSVDASFETLRGELKSTSMVHTVEAVIEASGLFDAIERRTDYEQVRANILRLIGYAQEFAEAQPETLAAAGFYGRGIGTFIGWLYFTNQAAGGSTCPKAMYGDSDAVELTTWHKSKGREWPVVYVCGMDKFPRAELPNTQIGYLDFSDLNALINNSRIEYSPAYDSKEKKESLMAELRLQAELIAMREIYVAISRPRDQLVLEWPEYALKGDSKIRRRIQILNSLNDIKIEESHTTINGNEHPSILTSVKYSWVDWSAEGAHACSANIQTLIGRACLVSKDVDSQQSLAQISPSQLAHSDHHAHAETRVTQTVSAQRLIEGVDLGDVRRANELGTLVHRMIEFQFSAELNNVRYQKVLSDALLKHVEQPVVDDLWRYVKELEQALREKVTDARVAAEVPLVGAFDSDQTMVGTIDLVLANEEQTTIIDHKTDRDVDSGTAWERHQLQLKAYEQLIPNSKTALNMVRSGDLITSTGSDNA